eukprot:COSAG06_NODE_828_length_12054_cov_67.028440_4_plen_116_part_00
MRRMRGCLRNCKLRGSAPRQQEQEQEQLQLQLQPIRHTARVRVTMACGSSTIYNTIRIPCLVLSCLVLSCLVLSCLESHQSSINSVRPLAAATEQRSVITQSLTLLLIINAIVNH